ncbi:MAG: nucleoside triphosphate pyrophosphohydrolase [Candidatus Acidiferrales bacterium]
MTSRRKRKNPEKSRGAKTASRPRQPSAKKPSSAASSRASAGAWFEKLMALQRRLRAPNGCPWDREQTHRTLRKYLIEETYEVLDAMDSGDARKFSSELGDLLLQVVFHSVLGEEAGAFTVSDVIASVHTKMVSRHPHVFGRVRAKNSAEVLKNWEQIKAQERAAERGGRSESESILSGVPKSLPGVLEAYQLTRRAARIGFDWENLAGVLEKLTEEQRELASAAAANSSQPRVEEETGDLLFAAVNVARLAGVDPEIALKKASRKFQRRFEWMERAAASQGSRIVDLPRARMEELWNQAKAAGVKSPEGKLS